MFACCGLVGNPHLTAKRNVLLPFQRQPRKDKLLIFFVWANDLAVPSHSLQGSFSSKNRPNPWENVWFPKRTMGEENGESTLRLFGCRIHTRGRARAVSR